MYLVFYKMTAEIPVVDFPILFSGSLDNHNLCSQIEDYRLSMVFVVMYNL